MKFSVSSDANWETRTDRISRELSKRNEFFADKPYGAGVAVLGLVLMCRDPDLDFRQRITYKQKRAELYVDIMLDYETMVSAPMIERLTHVVIQIKAQMRAVLFDKKLRDFNKEGFLSDLDFWLDDAMSSCEDQGSSK